MTALHMRISFIINLTIQCLLGVLVVKKPLLAEAEGPAPLSKGFGDPRERGLSPAWTEALFPRS